MSDADQVRCPPGSFVFLISHQGATTYFPDAYNYRWVVAAIIQIFLLHLQSLATAGSGLHAVLLSSAATHRVPF